MPSLPSGCTTEYGTYVDLEKTPEGLRVSLTDLGRREFEEFERLRDEFGIP